MNEYEKDNYLQAKWRELTSGGCLCTMRESCEYCTNHESRREEMNIVICEARNFGYQLYSEPGFFLGSYYEPKPIRMVRCTTSGYNLD